MLVTSSGIEKLPVSIPGTNQIVVRDELKIGATSPEQSRNAPFPMLVTLFGIVIDVSPEQPENAPPPMLVTPSGIVIDVSPEQP